MLKKNLFRTMACLDSETFIDGIGCIPNDPVKFVSKFYGIGLSVIGAVALLCIIFGGFTILTSQGNPSRIQYGKNYIIYSILGLLLAIFAVLIMQIVFGDVLKIPGFSK